VTVQFFDETVLENIDNLHFTSAGIIISPL
jgi:hypothetical protein